MGIFKRLLSPRESKDQVEAITASGYCWAGVRGHYVGTYYATNGVAPPTTDPLLKLIDEMLAACRHERGATYSGSPEMLALLTELMRKVPCEPRPDVRRPVWDRPLSELSPMLLEFDRRQKPWPK
jgi:hypothetical protein